MSNFQFVKNIYSWGMDIKAYVGSWITKDEYKQITGSDYVDTSTATSASSSESTSLAVSQA